MVYVRSADVTLIGARFIGEHNVLRADQISGIEAEECHDGREGRMPVEKALAVPFQQRRIDCAQDMEHIRLCVTGRQGALVARVLKIDHKQAVLRMKRPHQLQRDARILSAAHRDQI